MRMTDGRFERPEAWAGNQHLVADLKQFLEPQSDTHHFGDTTLAGYTRPAADCGGDWWTARRLDDGKLFVLIADVMGHDLGAAIIMGVGKAVCELACSEAGIVRGGELLHIMNSSIFEAGNQGQVTMTCFVSIIDPLSRMMTFASAGHPQPLLLRSHPAGIEAHILKSSGNPLGLDDEASYDTSSIQLQRDDIVFWFTDGVTESRSDRGERLSDRRLIRLLGGGNKLSAESLRSRVLAVLNRMDADNPQTDDVTFIVGRIG